MEIETVKSDVGMSWQMVNLGDVCDIKNGRDHKKVNNPNGLYPIIGSGGVMGFANDFLCEGNATIIGRKGSINNPIFIDSKFWNVDTAFALCTKKDLDAKFFYYFCRTYNFEKHNKATTLPSLTKTDLLEIQIPLPPLSIQRRIAEILDAADGLKRKDQQLLKKYDELAQAIFIDMFGDPVKNEKGWDVKMLGDVINEIEAGSSYGGEDKVLEDDELGVLKVSAVTSGMFRADEYKAVKKSIIQKKPIFVQQGDFLFSRANTRELVGATCIVDQDYNYLFLPDKIWRIVLNIEKCNPLFIKSVLSQRSVRYELNKTATGTSGSMLNISMQKLKDLSVIVPPITLQNKYGKIHNNWQIIREKSKDVNIYSDSLFQTLLQKAFKGELV